MDSVYCAIGLVDNRLQDRARELAWLLACLTPLGWLNRMIHFKEKAGKNREMAGLGLYAYPVLMAVSSVVSDRDNSSQAGTMVNRAI